MGDLVNLNRARKAKAKELARDSAAANRVKYGRTKAEKSVERAEKARAERGLDGHRVEPD